MKLSNKEAENATSFIVEHRKCKTICQSMSQTHYTIALHTCAIGSWVIIKCGKCHAEKDISDDVRINW